MIGLDKLAEQLSRTARLQRVTEIEVASYVEEAETTGESQPTSWTIEERIADQFAFPRPLRGYE